MSKSPFDFYTTYIIKTENPNLSYLALGITTTTKNDGFIFLIPGSGVGGGSFKGKAHKEGDQIKLETTVNDNKTTITFEPLTIEGLKKMPPGSVSNVSELLEKLKTDDQLQYFYRDHYLHDYWVENFKNGIKHDG